MMPQQPFNSFYNQQQMALANSQLAQRMQNNGYNYNSYNGYNSYNTDSNFQVVNGRESAEMYVMPPNSRVILMDRSLPRIYLKETDAANQYRITAYDLVEIKENQPQPIEYVTRQEFEEWKRAFNHESPLSESGSATSAVLPYSSTANTVAADSTATNTILPDPSAAVLSATPTATAAATATNSQF